MDLISFRPSVMGAIPEPTNWVMLIFGFGAIGAGMRRKAKRTTKISYA